MLTQCSILICTHNRADILRETLACLSEQLRNVAGVELIVVDNASTDQTKAVVGAFPEARYVYEAQTGLSHARNRAMREASYEHLVFIDDDVIPTRGWFRSYLDFFSQRPDSVAFWGGPVSPHFETAPSDDIGEEELRYLSRAWSLVDPSGEPDRIQTPEQLLPIGANFGGLRSVFVEAGFDPNFGRSGAQMTSLEETDLLQRVMRNGFTGAWVRGASLDHRIPSERLSRSYLARFYYGFGRSEQALCGSHGWPKLIGRCMRHGMACGANFLGFGRSRKLRHFVKWHYYRGQLAQWLSGGESSRRKFGRSPKVGS